MVYNVITLIDGNMLHVIICSNWTLPRATICSNGIMPHNIICYNEICATWHNLGEIHLYQYLGRWIDLPT